MKRENNKYLIFFFILFTYVDSHHPHTDLYNCTSMFCQIEILTVEENIKNRQLPAK